MFLGMYYYELPLTFLWTRGRLYGIDVTCSSGIQPKQMGAIFVQRRTARKSRLSCIRAFWRRLSNPANTRAI